MDYQRGNRRVELLGDGIGDGEILDTRNFSVGNSKNKEELPRVISGTYTEDYNILYVNEIIKKKLAQEKYSYLQGCKIKLKKLKEAILQPQTYIARESMVKNIKNLEEEIYQIESGERIKNYNNRVKDFLSQYRQYMGKVKTVIFDEEEEVQVKLDDDVRKRIATIESFFEVASEYIEIDVVRINNSPCDICSGCGESLAKVATNEDGTIRCPNLECQTEHNVIIMAKLAKDGLRINTSNNCDDESLENFLKAFTRYQGLQLDCPDEKIYKELDEYFARCSRPSGDEIKKLPLNDRGRRGDTNHVMLRDALSQIGRSEYYQDANLIGHKYWGWSLPNVEHYRENIIMDYIETQKGFYQIPPEERCRNSSLGTEFRLWRHLQLVGHECYMDEFKIAENSESLRIHNKLWRLMCEASTKPHIRYIP